MGGTMFAYASILGAKPTGVASDGRRLAYRVRRALIAVIFATFPIAAAADNVSFGSDTTWPVTDATSVSVGTAQYVCLNALSPPSCPAGATLWGFGGAGLLTQSLAAIPGAHWIWAPGLTGASPGASLAKYSFTKTVTLNGTPLSGTVYMLADDYVELRVNGTLVGTVGSIVNQAASGAGLPALVSFNVLPNLVSGPNTISFTAQNGPDSFAGVVNATYSQNPASVVFGGNLTSSGVAAAPALIPTLDGWMLFALAGLLALATAFNWRRRR